MTMALTIFFEVNSPANVPPLMVKYKSDHRTYKPHICYNDLLIINIRFNESLSYEVGSNFCILNGFEAHVRLWFHLSCSKLWKKTSELTFLKHHSSCLTIPKHLVRSNLATHINNRNTTSIVCNCFVLCPFCNERN